MKLIADMVDEADERCCESEKPTGMMGCCCCGFESGDVFVSDGPEDDCFREKDKSCAFNLFSISDCKEGERPDDVFNVMGFRCSTGLTSAVLKALSNGA